MRTGFIERSQTPAGSGITPVRALSASGPSIRQQPGSQEQPMAAEQVGSGRGLTIARHETTMVAL
jgi:hypothetical protein